MEYISKCILVKSLDGGHLRHKLTKASDQCSLKEIHYWTADMPLVLSTEQLYCVTWSCRGVKENLCGMMTKQ